MKIYSFIKIQNNKEYLEHFQSGYLFMRTFNYFRNLDFKKYGDRADKFEGVSGIFQPDKCQIQVGNIALPNSDFI